jgi:hypothetical protein
VVGQRNSVSCNTYPKADAQLKRLLHWAGEAALIGGRQRRRVLTRSGAPVADRSLRRVTEGDLSCIAR